MLSPFTEGLNWVNVFLILLKDYRIFESIQDFAYTRKKSKQFKFYSSNSKVIISEDQLVINDFRFLGIILYKVFSIPF